MNTKVADLLATFFYVGRCPVAPGTAASAVGVAIAFALHRMSWLYLLAIIVVTVVGFWAAGPAEKASGKKDPGFIVIDEVAGMMIALFMLPLTWPVMITGFFLFRAFDMFKIPPADKFENMGGATGIMTDDLMAGLYTNIVLQIAIRLALRF